MRRYMWLISLFLALILAATGCTAQSKTAPTSSTASSVPSGSTQVIASDSVINAIETTVESIYNQNNQSVVNIQVILQASLTNPRGAALGSGFVWDTAGHIVTNNHVVDGATRITVTFYDGTTVEASLVGADPDSDLAVIKVNVPTQQLQPVKLADSNQLKVGQLAIAIGIPLAFKAH